MNFSQISGSCSFVSQTNGEARSDSKESLPLESSIQRLQRLSLQDSIAVVDTDLDSQPKLQSMQVAKILFTQASVSSTFTNGSKVADLAQKLAGGEISAKEIDPIRVVWYQGKVWSLDNRRLRAFKDGFVEWVEVELVDLKNPTIKREFWDKKSNKSATEGGSFREDAAAPTAQQFSEGIYVFNKRILNWTFEKIDQPMPSYEKNPLQDRYSNRYNYYKSFENLIFEEARAILQAGIQQAKMDEQYPFQFSLIRLKIAKTAENPTEIKFSILPKSERDAKAGDVFLLEHADYPQLQLIGLANYCPIDQGNPELTFKVVVDRMLMTQFPTAFNQDEPWKAKALGSLITLQRMYEVCTTFEGRAQSVLEANILSGISHLPDVPQVTDLSEQQRFVRLNPSQRDAVERFLLLKEGLFLIQGPPGTGKTTTVTQLLGALQERGERVLVCAPSNKAVQILAERFMQEFSDVPMVLVGVEQKLPLDSRLNSIFMDTWYQQKDQFLMNMTEKLSMFQMHKLVPKDLKSLPNQIQKTCQNLERFGQELASFVRELGKYRLSYLNDLEAQYDEFYQSLVNYSRFLSSQKLSVWQEVKAYYSHTEEEKQSLEIPICVREARLHLSSMSIVLSTLKEKISRAQEDRSSKGLEAELLNHSQIIFATLSVSGQQRFKNIGSIDALIVDEAGQAVEVETLIPMKANPKKCLLIGDIQQLPATVISQDAEKLKFGRSLMERLIEDCEQPFVMLKTQYRMHPEISSWPSRKYYRNELENHTSVCDPKHTIKPIGKAFPFLAPYAFIDIPGKEERGSFGRSYFNKAEVNSIATIVDYLARDLRIQVAGQVSVISFYAAQVDYISKVLKKRFPNIKVNTVDGFQGGESDIVIISCVRANREKQIGFLKASKRLNVALTRAKYSLIVLGNKDTLIRSDVAELVADAQERSLLFEGNVLQQLIPQDKNKSSPQNRGRQQQLKGKSVVQKKSNYLSEKNSKAARALTQSDYKTQLCRHYALSSCFKGSQCRFAHGDKELRQTRGSIKDSKK